jgi:hypothetical protein
MDRIALCSIVVSDKMYIGKTAQANALAGDIKLARLLRAADIRINKEQVNADGIRVGRNRPDLQFTLLGKIRIYIEYDSPSSGKGPARAARIFSNDACTGKYRRRNFPSIHTGGVRPSSSVRIMLRTPLFHLPSESKTHRLASQ